MKYIFIFILLCSCSKIPPVSSTWKEHLSELILLSHSISLDVNSSITFNNRIQNRQVILFGELFQKTTRKAILYCVDYKVDLLGRGELRFFNGNVSSNECYGPLIETVFDVKLSQLKRTNNEISFSYKNNNDDEKTSVPLFNLSKTKNYKRYDHLKVGLISSNSKIWILSDFIRKFKRELSPLREGDICFSLNNHCVPSSSNACHRCPGPVQPVIASQCSSQYSFACGRKKFCGGKNQFACLKGIEAMMSKKGLGFLPEDVGFCNDGLIAIFDDSGILVCR